MANQLMLHCGAHHATIDQVDAVFTPAPTESHFPVPHIALYESVQRHIQNAGYVIKAEQHALHTVKNQETKELIDGANYFGLIELESDASAYGLVIGLRNSHAKSYSASIAIGSRVFVCDNLAFSGEVQIARKHTTNILRDLPQCVSAAVGRIADQRIAQAERIAAYQQRVLSQLESDHLLVDLLRARAVSSADIQPALREFDKPQHAEHLNRNGEPTVWTMFNAVTEAVTKGTNVFTLSRRTQALHGVCDSAAGVLRQRKSFAEALTGIEDAEYREAA